MRIEFVGSGYELLVGRIDEEAGLKFQEIGDELTTQSLQEVVGEWTEINDYVHFNGPDEDDCIMEVDGNEEDPNTGSPDDFNIKEMINHIATWQK